MAASYQRELDFLMSILNKLRLPASVHNPKNQPAPESFDHGLRAALGMAWDYSSAFLVSSQWAQSRTIYKIMDQFLCHYIYFHLPGRTPASTLIIGPFLTLDPTQEMLLEQAERLSIPLHLMSYLSDYYSVLPIFNDLAPIMSVIYSFGEAIWGPGAFDVVDVNYEQHTIVPASVSAEKPIEQTNILLLMAQMEERYAYENQLMEIVSKGLTDRAEIMMSSVSQLNYQQRQADPLRNMKNYCIICNTILRKAAQNGGVHPLYLDRMSSSYARTIETSPTLDRCSALIGEMIRAYCRLVRTHTSQHLSTTVQKTLTYIDANLSGDLSLSTLAELLQVTPSYLSSLFHQETGKTLTDHITAQRMKTALQLLQTTKLQVQTIAQLCGFSDPNYFTRQFKRYHGLTPLRCRQDTTFLRNE